jgi:hemolysin D
MSSTTAAATPRHPVIELLARYRALFAAAWQARHELAGPKRLADEAAFLPAALALQATPIHPAPRRVALVLCTLFAIALLWAAFGQIDIVAVAQGRVVVGERTKTIQPLEAGVVKRIAVKDGDAVKAGQVLIELDATEAQANQTNVGGQLASASSEFARTTALLEALSTARSPGGDAQTQAEWQDISARRARAQAELVRREAEAATVQQTIAKLEATLPLARQRETDFKDLAAQGFMNQHAGQDRARERIEQERDLATQRARAAEAQAGIAEARQTLAALLAETNRALRERQAKAQLERHQLTQEQSKTDQRRRLTQLTAPVDGVVQQLAVHTAGGVVTPAQALLVIVPQDVQVTAEVVVDNKDIGFIHEGQDAEIKLDTFPFTRYGTVPATVLRVSADAVQDDKRGAVFLATLQLKHTHLTVDGKRIALAPGMNLSAEVKTGKRRVIDYLLAPVQSAAQESLKER